MRILTAIFVLFLSVSAFAQNKKVIDHTVYNDWKSLKGAQISNDGRYISYQIAPHRGDGVLCIYDTQTGTTDTLQRAERAEFSGGSTYIAFRITPGFDTLRTLELDDVKKSKWPKDSLGIYFMETDSLAKFPELTSFTVNDENDWMAVEFKHNELKDNSSGKKKKKKKRRKNKTPDYESDGHILWLFHPTETSREFKDMRAFQLSREGKFVAFTVHNEINEVDSVHLSIFDLSAQTLWSDPMRFTDIQSLTFDHSESRLAYMTSADTSEVKQYQLLLVETNGRNIATLDNAAVGVDTLHAISTDFAPRFTLNDQLMYFGVGDRKFEEPEDTLLDSEKVKLDLWHYADDRLQPQQLLELKRDETASWLYCYHLKNGSIVQLGDDTLSVYAEDNLKGNYLLASNEAPYERTYNWVAPTPSDIYRVDVRTGERERLLLSAHFSPDLSPSGKTLVYFCENNYFYRDIASGSEHCITCDTTGIKWTADMNGMPMEAYPEGDAIWNRDESVIYLQSRFDVWEFHPDTKQLTSFSHELGKLGNVELRPRMWESDSVYFDATNTYFHGFDRTTKGTHFYHLKDHVDHYDLVESGYFDAAVFGLERSKDKSRSMLRKMTFQDYPEVYTFSDDMTAATKISETNPQQSEYKWGTVELTKWTSYDGFELEGLIYKPEDFDSTKSYPLLVYFYELYADRLHNHYIPKPTASIIYPTEYASAGYVIFMPDIRYKPGHPAASAYDCIMSGTDHVLNLMPNIDSTRMGLQGQSWGGYQTAQLVTMTGRYRAAMAGAPVANMFSAYGGIRWGSGLNRQFQYERTQSRIGFTIWERPDLYIENSPLFHLPNVTTPLMIMHNDDDGAVPWYQGIELFTGLRRLGKPAWLLNYNGDDHNLMRNANRIDLSIRMRQFFDYYLQNNPAPLWMTSGIPATVKGKELRYELDENAE